MKERVCNSIRRIQALTAEKCQTCPGVGEFRCCDAVFCRGVEAGLRAIGVSIPRTEHPTIPFMGPKGCVVPAEYRPGCSGYVCPSQLQGDRTFRREWRRLHERYWEDPEVTKMMAAATSIARETLSEHARA